MSLTAGRTAWLAYSRSDNDDGSGNFCTDTMSWAACFLKTSSRWPFPSRSRICFGHAVAIRYGETIIVATIIDTGGFEKYGH